jgi:glycine betaine/choline ABC-type transport system substrate-binding protein
MRAGLVLLFLLVAACGDDSRVVVGSKNFTEQRILGEIVAQTIERAGMRVRRRLDLGGTFVCDAGIRKGDLDLYVEYTGTALTAVLKQDPESDPRRVYERVAAAYRADGLEWLEPLGFDNTFAMVVRGDEAVSSLSEAKAVAGTWTAGFGYEFRTRPDGYPALQRVYGLAFADIRTMDLGLLYRALADRQADVVAGSATDGLIDAMQLRVLTDDRRAFPPYEAAPVVRGALATLAGRIPATDMRRMNHAVDGEHRDAAAVAREWLERAPTTRRRRRPCRRGRAAPPPRARGGAAIRRRPRAAGAVRRARG